MELRNRLVTVDPQRTITIDGATRPAIVVAENEPPNAGPPLCDAFYLHWGGARPVLPSAGTLMEMECTISYRTKGTDPERQPRPRSRSGQPGQRRAGHLRAAAGREMRLRLRRGGGSWVQHLLDAAGVQRAGQRATVHRTRGQRHRVLLSRGEPDMSNAKRQALADDARWRVRCALTSRRWTGHRGIDCGFRSGERRDSSIWTRRRPRGCRFGLGGKFSAHCGDQVRDAAQRAGGQHHGAIPHAAGGARWNSICRRGASCRWRWLAAHK